MHKKENKQVTVVSRCEMFEGARVVYRGVRSERAWNWVWHADLPDRPPAPATSGVVQRIRALIAQSNLSQYDKKQCRRSLARLSLNQLGRLEAILVAYNGKGSNRHIRDGRTRLVF